MRNDDKEVGGSEKSSVFLSAVVQDESHKVVTTGLNIAPDFLTVSTDSVEPTPYKLGIPTLRSATHRVRYSAKKGSYANMAGPKQNISKSNKNGNLGKDCISDRQFIMPVQLQCEMKLSFDTNMYDLRGGTLTICWEEFHNLFLFPFLPKFFFLSFFLLLTFLLLHIVLLGFVV